MPAALERSLKRRANKKGLKGEHKDAYVYGTLRKTGWKPSREKHMNTTDNRIIRLAAINKSLDPIIELASIGSGAFWSKLGRGAEGAAPKSLIPPPPRRAMIWKAGEYPTDYRSTARVGRSASPFRGTIRIPLPVKRFEAKLDAIINFDYDDEEKRRGLLAPAAAGAAAGVGGYLGHQAITGSGGYGANWESARKAFGRTGGASAFGKPAMASPGYRIGALVGNPTGNIPKVGAKIGKSVKGLLGKIGGLARFLP